jgi:hypothetical protein
MNEAYFELQSTNIKFENNSSRQDLIQILLIKEFLGMLAALTVNVWIFTVIIFLLVQRKKIEDYRIFHFCTIVI